MEHEGLEMFGITSVFFLVYTSIHGNTWHGETQVHLLFGFNDPRRFSKKLRSWGALVFKGAIFHFHDGKKGNNVKPRDLGKIYALIIRVPPWVPWNFYS